MFVSNLYTDKWTGNKNEESFIQNPTLKQIETAIRELDGKIKTLVSLEADDESYMMIGGGESGKYIVTATLDNENFHATLPMVNYKVNDKTLELNSNRRSRFQSDSKSRKRFFEVLASIRVKPENNQVVSSNKKEITDLPKSSKTEQIEKLIVGGQSGNYPAKMCVDLDQCLIAAKKFADSGELTPIFTWEKDESLVMV